MSCANCNRNFEEFEVVISMVWAIFAPVARDNWAVQRFADPPIRVLCQACAKKLGIIEEEQDDSTSMAD